MNHNEVQEPKSSGERSFPTSNIDQKCLTSGIVRYACHSCDITAFASFTVLYLVIFRLS